jgi:hypothetical protein
MAALGLGAGGDAHASVTPTSPAHSGCAAVFALLLMVGTTLHPPPHWQSTTRPLSCMKTKYVWVSLGDAMKAKQSKAKQPMLFVRLVVNTPIHQSLVGVRWSFNRISPKYHFSFYPQLLTAHVGVGGWIEKGPLQWSSAAQKWRMPQAGPDYHDVPQAVAPYTCIGVLHRCTRPT